MNYTAIDDNGDTFVLISPTRERLREYARQWHVPTGRNKDNTLGNLFLAGLLSEYHGDLSTQQPEAKQPEAVTVPVWEYKIEDAAYMFWRTMEARTTQAEMKIYNDVAKLIEQAVADGNLEVTVPEIIRSENVLLRLKAKGYTVVNSFSTKPYSVISWRIA